MYPKISEELLAKYFAKETTEPDNHKIQLWLKEDSRNQQLYDEYQLIWNNSFSDTKPSFNKDSVYQKIDTAIYDEKKKTHQLNRRKYLKFAASILLFVGLASAWLMFFNHQPEMLSHSTEYGQKLKLTLPDGSRVHLNSGSTIGYPDEFSSTDRIVQLTGEAFFEVKKNAQKPFIVKTGQIETTVLGTSFNIKAYNFNEQAITVASGSVQVNKGDQSVILEPNQRAYIETEALKSENVLASEEILWKDGILNFKDTPMHTVKTRLEKWYNVRINFENNSIQNCVFTGQFKNEKLMIVLEVLKETFGISYEVKSKEILIKGKGC